MKDKYLQNSKAIIDFAFICFIVGCIIGNMESNCDATIVYPKAPDDGRQIVYEKARQILQSDPRFVGGLRFEELTIADPYRNCGVGLKDLTSGRFLSVAGFGGWTYHLFHGTNVVGSGELTVDKTNGKALAYISFEKSPFDDSMLQAVRIAEQLPQIKKQDYELRRLNIPPILFVAVWLHGKSDDIIIPLPPTFGRWNAYQPYSEKQMIKVLEPAAKKKLKEPTGTLD